ncbi:uncharacterized protein [Mytilus edulis]|uniref:uncharacterized protein isoform X1 n=1 Tax=Mytilus edulis TaxID=6550 RepID=UPI0039EE639A
MTTLRFVFIILFVALIFQHINGEICGGDYAAEYVCDIGSCCKVNGRWHCLTDEQDSYMCEKTSDTSGWFIKDEQSVSIKWNTWHTIVTVVGGVSIFMSIVACLVRMSRHNRTGPRRDDEERFAHQEVRS